MNIMIAGRILLVLLVSVAVGTFADPAVATTPNPVPYLNPIVPSATAPGGSAFTLNITGTAFVSGSVVYWNGSPLATTFVSSTKLKAMVTAANIANPGTATLTVRSPAPGGGVSNFQFFEVVTPAQPLNWTFKDVASNVALTSPVLAADFNNDGKLDLVAAIGQTVWTSLGKGDGTFQTAIPSVVPATSITAINFADVNGDGKLDLIVSGAKGSTGSFVATMIGNGDGSFQAPIETDFSGLHLPQGMILADYNGDGILDLAFASGLNIQTLLGKGDGTFQLGPSTACNQIPLNVVATGDFNGDGKADIVVTMYDLFSTGFDFVEVFPGNGDGSFGTPLMVNGSGSAFVGAITAAVGDFNGDGNLDIATAIQTSGATIQEFIQISLGNGDGTFQTAMNVPNVTEVTTPLLVGDFNGDGNLDLVTGGFCYFGRGDGTFPSFTGSSGNPSTYVLAGDFDGDGQQDLVDEQLTLSGSTVLYFIQLTLQVPPAPDFTGIIGPYQSILTPGGSTSITSTLHPLYGFTGDVVVGATDLPQGVTPSYNPVVVKGGSGSTIITLKATSSVAVGNYTITLTGNSGNITHTAQVPITVSTSYADWSGSVESRVQNTVPGGSVTYVFDVTPLNGVSSGSVIPSISGLPPGVTATFNPTAIPESGGSTKLTLQTSSSTPQPQVYTMTTTGSDGVFTHSGHIFLGVSASGGDFTGLITPTQATTAAGGAVTYTLSYSPVNGGAGDVTLSVDGIPGGALATFQPAIVTGGSGSSTLTVNTSSGTLPGTYPLVITSVGSGVMHEQYLTLVVTP